jgi:hypothetical protein
MVNNLIMVVIEITDTICRAGPVGAQCVWRDSPELCYIVSEQEYRKVGIGSGRSCEPP